MYNEYCQSSDHFRSKGDSSFAHIEEILQRSKKEAHRHSFHFGGGAALVLIVLIIISLLCFAALCIISARADERLTDRYEEEVSEYYHAQNQGTAFIAKANKSLQQIYEDSVAGSQGADVALYQHEVAPSAENDAAAIASVKTAYYASASELDGCTDPSNTTFVWHDALQDILANTGYQKEAENTPLLVFSAPVNDRELYLVVALVHFPDSEDPSYLRVLSAKTISTVTYDYDTTLDVMKRS